MAQIVGAGFRERFGQIHPDLFGVGHCFIACRKTAESVLQIVDEFGATRIICPKVYGCAGASRPPWTRHLLKMLSRLRTGKHEFLPRFPFCQKPLHKLAGGSAKGHTVNFALLRMR